MSRNTLFEVLYFLNVNNTATFHSRIKNFILMGRLLSGNHTNCKFSYVL